MSEETNPLKEPLSLIEARILGCLCEKETTTPEYYPLTLNALVNACNQKSNRKPVMELDEVAVDKALESLRFKHLVYRVSQANSRVAKFKHSIEQVFPTITDRQRAILAELLIRGPQTPGELRTRCERMARFDDLPQVKDQLETLAQGAVPLVKELPRQPGKKDARFAHLLSGEPDLNAEPVTENAGPLKVEVAVALPVEAEERIANLESTVATQAEQIASLRAELDSFRAQFE